MFNLKYLFSILCILSFCGNLLAQTEAKPSHSQKTELTITLKKSDPHGQSSAYNLTVQPDGKVLFEGGLGTKIKGNVEEQLSQSKINQLIDEIVKANFFSLDDNYTPESKNCPWYMLDSPTIILFVKLNKKEKTITHYLGCGEQNEFKTNLKSFPKQLDDLENKIDEIVETKRWIGERK